MLLVRERLLRSKSRDAVCADTVIQGLAVRCSTWAATGEWNSIDLDLKPAKAKEAVLAT